MAVAVPTASLPADDGFSLGGFSTRRALVLAEAAMKSAVEGRFVKVSEIG